MQLQTHSHAQGTLFALLGAIETSVSGQHDSSLAQSNRWHSAREIGGTQMTPLAQSFQTLYNTLEQLSYSFDVTENTKEPLPEVVKASALIPNDNQLESYDLSLTSETGCESHEGVEAELSPESNPLFSSLPTSPSVSESSKYHDYHDIEEIVSTDSTLSETTTPLMNMLSEQVKRGVQTRTLVEGDEPIQSKIAADVASVLESHLQDMQASEPPVLSVSGEVQLIHRLVAEAVSANSANTHRSDLNLLSQYASSMQSQTPSSLKVNEAGWRAVVNQLQPTNNVTLPVTTETISPTLDSGVGRPSSLSLSVEKSLPIEAQRQIYQVVKDKVQLQVDMNTQVARIRFDPPELGRMEMVLRIEGDKLTVHMNASAATTREALLATSERLRHELIAQNSALSEVEVALSQQRRSANPEQYHASFFSQEPEDIDETELLSVPEYTAYIARV
ncbi:flagellar hook-length control protein FliK [Vibrio sp. 10N]|uniref:flagellar hook-length control protein FliK n=1 Tax=Vibrio sp. 10N TaxID=3058938 RepID=UPI00281312B0|nr:hypothetical protein VB10N_08090 [Vibrio sp. 10N]